VGGEIAEADGGQCNHCEVEAVSKTPTLSEAVEDVPDDENDKYGKHKRLVAGVPMSPIERANRDSILSKDGRHPKAENGGDRVRSRCCAVTSRAGRYRAPVLCASDEQRRWLESNQRTATMSVNPADSLTSHGPRSALRRFFVVLSDTYARWRDDRTIRLGAGLAFYGIFAIIPLLTLSIALAQVVFSEAQVESALGYLLVSLFGSEAEPLADAIVETLDSTGAAVGMGLVGFISLIVAASLLFVALEDALNVIWDVPPQHGMHNLVRRYGMAYLVVILTGSLLMAALVVQAVAGLAEQLVPGEMTVLESFADFIAVLGSWALGVAALGLLFRVLPHANVPWRAALTGAGITAVFMALGTWALGEYIDRFGTSSLAGAAGAVLLVTVWIYYTAQTLLAGAVLTRVLTVRTTPVDA
jgi:membrane protein